jgi:uncharacterized protein
MIRRVSADGIQIGDTLHTTGLLLTAEEILGSWDGKPVDELEPTDFETLLATDPELILLGTGERARFAPREVTFALARRQVGLEVMDTGAAARTFNVLAGEGRRVSAILYL